MRAVIYVDGFNLYYGALRYSLYRWLNIEKLCQIIFPKNSIVEIKYFTALVKSRPNNPHKHIRQQLYIRALETIPNLKVIYGSYLESVDRRYLASPIAGQPKTVEVINPEEKGSDVNLAINMIHDGHLNLYDVAVLITNDSDQAATVRMVRRELRKEVAVVSPYPKPNLYLTRHATYVRTIESRILKYCPFSNEMSDANGTFYIPPEWAIAKTPPVT